MPMIIAVEQNSGKFSITVLDSNGELDRHEMGHSSDTLSAMSGKIFGVGALLQVEVLERDNGNRIFIMTKKGE